MKALILLALAFSLAGIAPGPAEPLRMVTGHYPPLATDDRSGFTDKIEMEAFRRLGIDLDLQRVPTGRAGPLADTGEADGCGPRIAGYDKFFPNLVQVEEPVIDFEFMAFTKREDIEVRDWTSLSDYTVGHLTGSVILANKTKQHAGMVTSVRDAEQLFTLLERGRIDIAVIERWTGLYAVNRLELRDVRLLQPALAHRPMFFYLNRKHADLAPRLADALRAMKADGTYDRTFGDSLHPLLNALQADFISR